jgi:hypothetical protein
MTKIAEMLNGKISYLKSYEGYNMTVNLSKLDRVISYYNKYSLKTKKYLSYFNWLKVYKLVINKEHLNENPGLEPYGPLVLGRVGLTESKI